ncbi:putative membrane protein [Anaplasma phagocytophilum str. ApNP]|uniref:Putative membrane protein n=1 Tax=Anaplasma phagocytophilum str. ApNP TaxID=1359153 RepID=A0A0F3NH83_ANAPH|nr:putative membrane protein [Anaplasma phagocytophilum str. ApNP]
MCFVSVSLAVFVAIALGYGVVFGVWLVFLGSNEAGGWYFRLVI